MKYGMLFDFEEYGFGNKDELKEMALDDEF